MREGGGTVLATRWRMRVAIVVAFVVLSSSVAALAQDADVARRIRAADGATYARDRRWAREELREAEAVAPDDPHVDLARAALHHRRDPGLALAFDMADAAQLADEHDGFELERSLGIASGTLGLAFGLASGVLALYGTLDNGCTNGLGWYGPPPDCVSHPNQVLLGVSAAAGFVGLGLAISSIVMLADSLSRRSGWLDILMRGDLLPVVSVAPPASMASSTPVPDVTVGIAGRLP